MKKIVLLIILFMGMYIFTNQVVNGQQRSPGYPEREGNIDLRGNFANPPKGYGEVPFFWWMGDTLTREHLTWHLDKLEGRHISSLQVNYAHDDKGGIIYGKTFPSRPDIFTEEWWSLFGWFLEEAGKRNMTVSLSDYTLGVGQGSYVDEMLAEDGSLNGYELRFRCDTINMGIFSRKYNDELLSLKAYQLDKAGKIKGKAVDLLPLIASSTIEWKTKWPNTVVTEVSAERRLPSLDPMNPRSGDSYVRHFFQRFEDRFPGTAQTGLNFFFSDELNFSLSGLLWNDIFREEFRKRKGYDIAHHLDALFIDLGETAPAIRLDYNDVMVSLSEENFFIPLHNWHDERGLLFGCDHGGRGLDVTEFGDYFRTQRWNSAPGCDQPYIQNDIVKNKVAASISHLYGRERVWLEGFHSSGWSTSTEQLSDAIFSNYALGQNLLSLHGLYYSTMGGWWEWAPPCNHFHEPYWEEMKPLMECTERLSYTLSQGYHRADVALLYPVEPVVAGYGDECVKVAFAAGEMLYKSGIDFDFMDYESFARAEVGDKTLDVAGESFRVLIIPSMKAIRHSSLEKILEFKNKGGLVINIGDLPIATEKGLNSKAVNRLLKQINNGGANAVQCIDDPDDLVSVIDSRVVRDFDVLSGDRNGEIPYFQHRKIDGKELYFVYNVGKGSECFFRAKGGATLWDPWTGKTSLLPVDRVTADGTVIRMPLEYSDVHIITFDPAEEPQIAEKHGEGRIAETKQLDDGWRFEIVPVLDNKYGDFILPAFDGKVGAMIYKASYSNGRDKREIKRNFTFGTKFMMLGAVPEIAPEAILASLRDESPHVTANENSYEWQPYDFSWRWGVENDYGHQGWHGLKAIMYDDFIRLGKKEYTWNANEIRRVGDDNGEKNYYLFTRVSAPEDGLYQAEYGDLAPAAIYINGEKVRAQPELRLKRGINEILLHFDSYGTTRFALRDGEARIIEETLGEAPLRMKYRGDSSLLLFDIRKSADTRGRFSFMSAPGLKQLVFSSFGKATVSAGGRPVGIVSAEARTDGQIRYTATLSEPATGSVEVVIDVEEPWGYAEGCVIDGPVEQLCCEGTIEIGDWSAIEGLRAYSGGAWYRYDLTIDNLSQGNTVLDLGRVISTARVQVNGEEVGMRFFAPWRFDISDKLRKGSNLIEVFVTNTAANYYLSTPSRFGGSIESGIIGPVSVVTQIK